MAFSFKTALSLQRLAEWSDQLLSSEGESWKAMELDIDAIEPRSAQVLPRSASNMHVL